MPCIFYEILWICREILQTHCILQGICIRNVVTCNGLKGFPPWDMPFIFYEIPWMRREILKNALYVTRDLHRKYDVLKGSIKKVS